MSEDSICVILGGGGHARVLIDILQESGMGKRLVVLDRDPARWKMELLGITVEGDDKLLPGLVKNGADSFVVGLGGTGNNRPRKKLFELGLFYDLNPLSVVHPTAVCSKWATLGRGAQLLAASVINAGARLGDNCIVNTGAIVEHDCALGDHVHVATGARLASGCRVGRGAHIGAGATLRQGIAIGEYAVVGAGAVVVRDVPSRTVVVGVPARPLSKV